MTKEELQEKLFKQIVIVTFTKTNGDIREMACTLHPSFMPQPELTEDNEEESTRADNPNIIAVWDTVAEGWRSFRVDSVLKVVS
jgi:hypothetical protein